MMNVPLPANCGQPRPEGPIGIGVTALRPKPETIFFSTWRVSMRRVTFG